MDVLIVHNAITSKMQWRSATRYAGVHSVYPWMLFPESTLRLSDTLRIIRCMIRSDHDYESWYRTKMGKNFFGILAASFSVAVDVDYELSRLFLLKFETLRKAELFALVNKSRENRRVFDIPVDIIFMIMEMVLWPNGKPDV